MLSAYWVFNFVIPILVLVASAVVRYSQNIPQSATTDLLSLFIGFDVCIFYNRSEVAAHIPTSGGVDTIANSMIVLLILSLSFWWVCLYKVEPALETYYNKMSIPNVSLTPFPLGRVLMAWGSNATMITSHVLFVIGRLDIWSA